MKMYAVRKGNEALSIALATFRYRDDAENYIKDRWMENIEEEACDFTKAGNVSIENDCFIQPIELEETDR